MKISATSDTHGHAFWEHIPECDLCIIGGDISPNIADHSVNFQRQWTLDTFIPDLAKVPAKYKVFIAGNHDFYLYELYKNSQEDTLRNILPPNVFYLRDSMVELEGVRIYGTPWVTNLHRWAFNLKDYYRERKKYSDIPDNVDILVSHAPAYKYCDTIKEYDEIECLGSEGLIQAIDRRKPKMVLTGHIHSANHEFETFLGFYSNPQLNVKIKCVSLLDESYKIKYPPFVFNYTKEEGLQWNS